MMRFSKILLSAMLLVAGLAASAAAQTTTPQRPARVLDFVPMLTGTFDGSTPGNELHAIISSLASQSPADVSNLSIRITGKYLDTPVRLQGVLRLESQGRTLVATYVPHFDPTVGIVSTEALVFQPRELEAACSFDVSPRGDGFFGETIGQTTCARAVRGATGKWSFEVEPGAIRIRSAGSGETLRFKRVSK
ncbi:MAG TPA: hypothetical protein VIA45_17720 [Thermoanaerobaculia bacterium]|jgi:hypothetical protein